jgi:hypothetical protein
MNVWLSNIYTFVIVTHIKQTCEDISAVEERTAAERLTAPRGGETRLPGHGTGFCCTVLPGWADDPARRGCHATTLTSAIQYRVNTLSTLSQETEKLFLYTLKFPVDF